jgi:hypothetical protein
MGYLLGLQEYLDENYETSIFDQVIASGKPWELHLHGCRTIKALIFENRRYELTVTVPGQGKEEVHKTQIKLLYPADLSDSVKPLIKTDEKVKALCLEPILSPNNRYFVKNKSLFPLMKEKEAVFFTLLEGEMIKGIVAGFSRYDIAVNLKGGLPVTILRHSIYALKKTRAHRLRAES